MNTHSQGFDPSAFSYRAFISYSRADSQIVDDLYRRLTHYRTPQLLRDSQGAFGMPPRSFRIFLDRMSIEAGGTVPDRIKQKLADSAFLIVVCSKTARTSHWVNEEVRHFLTIASADRILPVFLRETRDTPLEEIVPDALAALGDDIPVGADLILDGGIGSVRDKLLGGLLGLAQDRIAQEQERADRRALQRRTLALSAISVLFLAASLAGLFAWTARNDALAAESRILARASTEASAERGLPDLGMLIALEALPRPNGGPGFLQRPFERQAATALATGVFWHGERRVIGTPSENIVYRSPAIDVSADGQRVLFAYGSRVEVHDGRAADLISAADLNADLGEIRDARLSRDGSLISIVMDSEAFLTLAADTGELVATGQTAGQSVYGDVRIRPGSDENLVFRSNQIWITDMLTGTIRTRLEGHTKQVSHAQYSDAGDRIMTLAFDRSARAWDADTGAELARLETDEHLGFRAAQMSAQGDFAITVTDSLMQRWSLPAGDVAQALRASSYQARFGLIDISPDGQLVAASEGEDIAIRNADDLTLVTRLQGHRNALSDVTFSPDGTLLASTSMDKTARVWDVATGVEIASMSHPNRPFQDVIFTAAGVLVSGRDQAAYFWDLPPNLPAQTLSGDDESVATVSFSPDGLRLVSAPTNDAAQIWNIATGELAMTLGNPAHLWMHNGARFDPTGQKILTFSEGEFASVWAADTGEGLWSIGADGSMRDGAFSPDGKLIALASADSSVGVLNADTGDILFQAEIHEGGARGVEFSPDGEQLMSFGSDGKIRFWDIASGAERLRIDAFGLSVFTAHYSPDGRRVVAGTGGGGQGVAVEYDVASGERVTRLYPIDGVVRQALFTPDGERVLTASADGVARLWDIETGSMLISVSSDQRSLSDVAISPDGQRFVTTAFNSDGAAAILWDLETGLRIADYYGQGQGTLDVEFAPPRAGQPMQFATAGMDGTIAIWEAPFQVDDPQLRSRACSILTALNRRLTQQEALQLGVSSSPSGPCD